MKMFTAWFGQISAVSYPFTPEPRGSFLKMPYLPEISKAELVFWLVLLMLLVRPLLKAKSDPILEKERINVLKLSAMLGFFALALSAYRIFSGEP